MSETTPSLLERFKSRTDASASKAFHDIYVPLLRGWLLREGFGRQEATGLAKRVLEEVGRKIGKFDARRSGSFSGWLRNITARCLRKFHREGSKNRLEGGNIEFEFVLEQLEDPDSDLTKDWDREYDSFVRNRLLERVKPEFRTDIWTAFRRLVMDQDDPDEIAERLGMSLNEVISSRAAVLQRVRELGDGILE